MNPSEDQIRKILEAPFDDKVDPSEVRALLDGELDEEEADMVLQLAMKDPALAKVINEELEPHMAFPRLVLEGANPFRATADDTALSYERKKRRISLMAADSESFPEVITFLNDAEAPKDLRSVALQAYLEAREGVQRVDIPDAAAAQGAAAAYRSAGGQGRHGIVLAQLVGVTFDQVSVVSGAVSHTLRLSGAVPAPGRQMLSWTWAHIGSDEKLVARGSGMLEAEEEEFLVELQKIKDGFYLVHLEWTEA